MIENMLIFAAVMFLIFVLSIVWYFVYTKYLKRHDKDIVHANSVEFLKALMPDLSLVHSDAECSVVLPNTDVDIAEALQFIEPSGFAGKLLESLYEQTRI